MASKKSRRPNRRNFHHANKFLSGLPELPHRRNGRIASPTRNGYGRFEVFRPMSFDDGYRRLGSQVAQITKKYQKTEGVRILPSPLVPIVTAGRFDLIQKTAEELGVGFNPFDILVGSRQQPCQLYAEVADVVTLRNAPNALHDYRVALKLDAMTKLSLQEESEELLSFCDLNGVDIGNKHYYPTVDIAKSNDLGLMYSIRSKIEELGVQQAGVVLGRISMRGASR